MIDFQRIYHTGMAVSDIHASAAQLGQDLNLEWAPLRVFDPLPFWTPEKGSHSIKVTATYSRQGPQHLELVQGPVGSFYDPALLPDCRHIGVWVDDLPGEIAVLVARGWKVLAAGAAPEQGYGTLAYIAPPMPGLLVELVSTQLLDAITEWINAPA